MTTLPEYIANININFPEIGVDNPSQTFRDNWNNIQNSLELLNTETETISTNLLSTSNSVSTLSSNAVLTTQSNNLNGNELSNGSVNLISDMVYVNTTAISTNTSIDITLGSYQIMQIAGDVTLNFINWPIITNNSKIRVELTSSNSSSHAVTFSSIGTLKVSSTFSFPVSVTGTASYVFDLWTHTSGSVVYVSEVGVFN